MEINNSKINFDELLNFRASVKSMDRRISMVESGPDLKERAQEEMAKIEGANSGGDAAHLLSPHNKLAMAGTPTNKDKAKMGRFLNELLEEDLVPMDRLKELTLKENGGYSCYRGHEYVDEEHKQAKGRLLFYIK